MWKGYRDADVAWIKVRETEERQDSKIGVVIYASRRGLLELWDLTTFTCLGAVQVRSGA